MLDMHASCCCPCSCADQQEFASSLCNGLVRPVSCESHQHLHLRLAKYMFVILLLLLLLLQGLGLAQGS